MGLKRGAESERVMRDMIDVVSSNTHGTLNIGEPHPGAYVAMKYVRGLGTQKLLTYLEGFASCSISGNRLGEICSETLRRVTSGEPVSDRYICGLAWVLLDMEEDSKKGKG